MTKDPGAQRELLLLGEALDLVTGRQGFKSPALIPLVSALIKRVRVLGPVSCPDEKPDAGVADAAAPNRAAPEGDALSEPVGAPEAKNDAAADRPAENRSVEPGRPVPPPSEQALQDRIAAGDKKLAALTAAVGQLVNVLQRRSWSGGIDRRDAPRVSGRDARVFVHDRPYPVINWSRKGFLIRARDANRIGMRDFDFHFVLDLRDETIEFQGRAKTVRIEGDALAAQFEDLDAKTDAKIAEVMANLNGLPENDTPDA